MYNKLFKHFHEKILAAKTRIGPAPVWHSGHNHNMISADCQIFPEIKLKGKNGPTEVDKNKKR